MITTERPLVQDYVVESVIHRAHLVALYLTGAIAGDWRTVQMIASWAEGDPVLTQALIDTDMDLAGDALPWSNDGEEITR